MSYQKLATVVAAASAALAMAGIPATPAAAQTNGPAVEATANAERAAGAQADVNRRSFKCGSERLNVSWASGPASTTIYFNNHCNTKKAIKSWWKDNRGSEERVKCITVNPNTKGKKRLWELGFDVYKVTSPRSC